MEQINEQIKSLENLIKANPKSFINYFYLGDVYRKIKKYDFALKNYLKSVKLNNKFPEGFNNLGNIYRELKDTKNSILFFKKAIKLNPNYINAIYNLGVVFSELGKYEESGNCFKKVLKIDSNHLPSLNNFGIILKNIEKYDEAIKCFEKITYINPKFVKAYNNIGTISLEQGNIQKAVKNYKKVIELDPNNFVSYKNLIATYENSNQIKKYEETLELAKNKFPNEKIFELYSGILLFRKQNFNDSIKKLENTVFKDEDGNESKRNFFLARCYDRTNKIDKAFKHFKLANKIEKNSLKSKKFDKNRYLKTLEKRKNYFTKNNINKWKIIKYPKNNFNPVFLVGFPRSGTTLLDTILRSHPKINVIEEKPMVLKMVDKIKNRDLNSLEKITLSEIKLLQNQYLLELANHVKIENNSSVYIDKLPLNIVNVAEIIRIFPNAKFILVLRHPMDCVLSCFMQNFNPNDAMCNFLDLKDSAVLYKNAMELWDQYTSVLKINYVSIKYEDLVQNFKSNIKIIIKFLNLDWSESLLNYRETAIKRGRISTPSYYQVIQPIYKYANQRWERYRKHLAGIEHILGKSIKKYKYKKKPT
tara:strand:+ start:69 stop:1835 length:1767 start_codon:yes stop_codon:yes gene_type:complete